MEYKLTFETLKLLPINFTSLCFKSYQDSMPFFLPKRRPHSRAQTSSQLSSRGNHRKRLQKPRPNQQPKTSIYSCKDVANVVRLQTCLNLLSGWNEGENSINMQLPLFMHSRSGRSHFDDLAGYEPDDLISNYSHCPTEEINMERRRNAKTPVFAIGQLEMKNPHFPTKTTAEDLAKIYQNLLPSPPVTPFPNAPRSYPRQEKIRRIKSQHSLRSHISDQLKTSAWTETETLCSEQFEPVENNKSSSFTYPEENPGLRICLDLLTCELAGVFFQQHPKENQDRASRLQIQLMIEGYEDVLQKMQQKADSLKKMGLAEDDLITTENILHHWLEILYYLYNLTDCLNQRKR